MAYSPYQTAGSQATLYDLFEQSKFRQQKASSATRKQRSKLTEEFEAELEAAQKAAQKKANKNKRFFKGLNILGSFLGPVGAGLTKGISALGQGQQQKKGLEKLLKGVDMKRWGKTFLKDPSKSYKEEAESMQMSSGDVLRGGLGAGLAGWGTSKIMGGDDGSIYKKLTSNIEKETGKKIFQGGVRDMLKPRGVFGETGLEFLPNPTAIDKLRGVWQGSGDLISPLTDSLKEGGTFKGGVDEMQSAMMLPMLLQQLFGGEY
jgi:hypothetical protein